MKKLNTLYLMVVIIISLASCKKGEVGPQGPAGPQGATGAMGDTGAQGNINVHATIFNLTATNWVQSNHAHTATFVDSVITQVIVDSGIVSVFYFLPSTSTWTPLPYSYTDIATGGFYTWTFFYSTNQIKFNIAQPQTIPPNPGSAKFKVVIISASGRNANPNLDWNDYEKIKANFNL